MFPLRSSGSGGSAGATSVGSSPPPARPRAVAVAGVSGGSYGTPQQQQLLQRFQQQQSVQQRANVSAAERAPVVLPRSSSSVSRGPSFQLLDTAGKRAAIAAYPSASEVLLRHTSSKNLPSLRPRPQSPVAAAAGQSFAAAGAAHPPAVAFPHPSARVTTTPPSITMLPGGGSYVPIPLRSPTAGVAPRAYTQSVHSAPRAGSQQQQQQSVRQQTGQQRPLAGQVQQMCGQRPLYPAYPVVYQQQVQQRQQQYPFQPAQGVRTQQMQRHYTGPQLVYQKQLQQQHSLPTLSRKTAGAHASPPRRLKSALRSQASSQHVAVSHSSSLKSGASVRFALDEDEVFRGKGESPAKAAERKISPPPAAAAEGASGIAALYAAAGSPQISSGATAAAAAEAALAAAGTAFPAAGTAAPAAEEAATRATKAGARTLGAAAPAAKVSSEAKGQGVSPAHKAAAIAPAAEPLVTAAPAAEGKEEEKQVWSQPREAGGLQPAGTAALVEAAASTAGDQQEKGGGRANIGVLAEKHQEDFVLVYRSLASPASETPSAAAFASRAQGSSKEATQTDTSRAFKEEESRSQLQAKRMHQESGKSKSSQDAPASVGAGRPKADAEAGKAGAEKQQAEQQQQQLEHRKKETISAPQEEATQRLQRHTGQQHAVQQQHQTKEKPQQTAARESVENMQQMKAAQLPCLWVGYADSPHVCINFSASFQPKLLVRRSSAPALHMYAEGQLPVKDYFVVASALRAAKDKVAAAEPTSAPVAAVDQAVLSAALTANSNARPGGTMPEGAATLFLPEQARREESIGEPYARAQEVQEAKDKEEPDAGANKTKETDASRGAATSVSPVPGDDTGKAERDIGAGSAAAARRDAPACEALGDAAAETGFEGTATEPEAHGVSRRDWLVLSSFFSFSPSAMRSASGILRLGSLPLETSEKAGQGRSRRGSSMSTEDGLSVDEEEWRWEMARPTILLHRPFHRRVEHLQTQVSPAAAGGGAATGADAGKTQRVLVVVDTTTEWWPSVQVRWVDTGKDELQKLEEQQERHRQQQHQQNQQGAKQHREAVGKLENADGTREVENELRMQKGLPTNYSGVCVWSNHRPTLLDLRV